jgi:hypothetical protein
MKKLNVLFFSLAILFLMSCGGGETAATGDTATEDTADVPELSEDEQIAARFCECNAEIPAIIEERKAERMDSDTYSEKLAEVDACFDPEGKLKAKEAAMTKEERKAYGDQFTELVKASCPELAKEFGME